MLQNLWLGPSFAFGFAAVGTNVMHNGESPEAACFRPVEDGDFVCAAAAGFLDVFGDAA